MADLGGSAGFAAKTCDEVLGIGEVGVHDFDRDGAVHTVVVGDVHRCHSAAGESADDPITIVEEGTDEGIGQWRGVLRSAFMRRSGGFIGNASAGAQDLGRPFEGDRGVVDVLDFAHPRIL